MKNNVIVLVPKKKPIFSRIGSFVTAGVVAAGTALVSLSTNAKLSGADVTAAFADSGADEVSSTAGLIVIGVAAALMAVGIGIRLFRKG